MGVKVGTQQRKYGNHRDYGIVDVDISREELAEKLISAAQWWQSDAVLMVAPDGRASVHLWGLIETDRLMKRHTDHVVGTFPMFAQSQARRERIRQRILTELRHHMGAPGERKAA